MAGGTFHSIPAQTWFVKPSFARTLAYHPLSVGVFLEYGIAITVAFFYCNGILLGGMGRRLRLWCGGLDGGGT